MSWGAMSGQMGWGVVDDGWRKGPWTAEEDRLLIEYVKLHGEGRWNSVARLAGLKRNGKSCRLRWVNYLRPDLKRGQITPQEESVIVDLHAKWGNRWSTIARSLPGRTDNEIKNYWRTHFKKKSKPSADNSEKAKNRLIRRQQFIHQQQQQQQQHFQHQQQLQFNQVDMKRIMSLLDEGYNTTPTLPQEKQEMLSIYPHNNEENGLFYSMLNGNSPFPEAPNEEIVWDGLWNLDDIHGNMNSTCASNKAAFSNNLVVPFC